ncbi:MAG TPA: flagellar motor protein MotB [Candidatus Desulfofervidus auxilii]|uniref:Flagellar motor protein MotB n=1 Tax=Desulfofervidus auxilii TaxID=1621989 RepID=A0A7V0IAP2_DESA2|nr:flagellar motor protein MotB [Candidatus Desulfofervidus auxilii]
MAERDPNGWMLTYSDMMTLLLTFFVLLIAMSSFDVEKFKTYARSVGQSLLGGTGIGVFKRGGTGKIKFISHRKVLEQLRRGVPENIVAELTKDIEVIPTKDGWLFRLPVNLLFAPNSTEISLKAYPILEKIAFLLKKILADVEVKGHTDNQEKNKWELSIKRAAKVVRYFTEKKGLNPERFVLMGFADTRPLVPNINDRNRARNRRVEIIIKKKKFIIGS